VLIDNIQGNEFRYEVYLCKPYTTIVGTTPNHEIISCLTECADINTVSKQLQNVNELEFKINKFWNDVDKTLNTNLYAYEHKFLSSGDGTVGEKPENEKLNYYTIDKIEYIEFEDGFLDKVNNKIIKLKELMDQKLEKIDESDIHDFDFDEDDADTNVVDTDVVEQHDVEQQIKELTPEEISKLETLL
jgi:hypothetical protein